MARPKKLTLDFFVHSANISKESKPLRRLERRHKCEGYSTYFKLLELICQEDGMKLDLSDPADLEIIADDFYLRDVQHLIIILQDCAEVGLIDKQLWESERIAFSHDLYAKYVERLEDRQLAAERKSRQKESDILKARIKEVKNKVITQENSVITQENSRKPREKTEVLRDKSPDNTELIERSEEIRNLSISSNYIHTGDRQVDAPCESVEPIEVEAVLIESDPIDSMNFDLAQSEPAEPKHQDIPFSTVEQPELFTTQTVSVEVKSSGATKKSSKKKKEAKVDNPSFWDELRDRYNANKPEFWARCDSFGPERRRSVTALRKCYGDEELLLRVEESLNWAATSSYWAAEQADFSCLLVKSHVERWSEAWRNRGNGKPRSQGDLKMMNLYKTVSSYFD